jgi:hypothetical protein
MVTARFARRMSVDSLSLVLDCHMIEVNAQQRSGHRR